MPYDSHLEAFIKWGVLSDHFMDNSFFHKSFLSIGTDAYYEWGNDWIDIFFCIPISDYGLKLTHPEIVNEYFTQIDACRLDDDVFGDWLNGFL